MLYLVFSHVEAPLATTTWRYQYHEASLLATWPPIRSVPQQNLQNQDRKIRKKTSLFMNLFSLPSKTNVVPK